MNPSPKLKSFPLALALTLLTASASAQQVNWAPLQMQNRMWHKMVYDSDRHVIVMFGGAVAGAFRDGAFANSESWEWDGSTWLLKSRVGPSPRYGHVMVYDSVRHVTLLIGAAGYSHTNDMWTWNGAAWTRLPSVAPSSGVSGGPADPSFGVFDTAHGEVVFLVQASNSSVHGTWTWNGQSWTRVSSSPMRASSMVFDPSRQRTVLFNATYSGANETWEWDGSIWELRNNSTGLRSGEAMAFDADRGVVVRHGGYTTTFGAIRTICSSDSWIWNGNTWILESDQGSPPRASHQMVYDQLRHKMVLFGGELRDPTQIDVGASADSFARVGNQWIATGTSHPSSREGAAIAFDQNRHVVVLFGGQARMNGLPTSPNCETWEWNGVDWVQRLVDGPSARAFHEMAYDSQRRRIVLVGGYNEMARISDTWEWDGTRWEQASPDGPGGEVALAYDTDRHVMIAQDYGYQFLSRTWIRTGASWSAMSVDSPPVSSAAMVYDQHRHVAVLFGGWNDTRESSDTWEWNGATWRHAATIGPAGRVRPAMAYDSAREVAVIAAGMASGPIPDDGVWEWNGTIWNERRVFGPETNPMYGPFPAMTYDADRRQCILFGSNAPETWGLGDFDCPHASVWNIGGGVACMNDSLELEAQPLSLERVVQYQWRFNGVPIDPHRNITANSQRLDINIQLSALGDYDCVVTDSCGSAISNAIHVTVCNSSGYLCGIYPSTLEWFLNDFFAGEWTADVNHDDVIDMFDYLDYIQLRDQLCH